MVAFGFCRTVTSSPAFRSASCAFSSLRRIVAPEGIVSVTVLYVAVFVPSVIVSLSPDSEEKLPRSIVMVSKPPLLLGTTASECTGGPAASASGPAPKPRNPCRCAKFAAPGVREEDAEVPAIPAAPPATAQSAPTALVRRTVDRFMAILLARERDDDRVSYRAKTGIAGS